MLTSRSRLAVSCLACLLGLGYAALLHADDIITPTKGSPARGKIVAMTSAKVTIEVNGDKKELPVNMIKLIAFDGEPAKLTNFRRAALNGPYQQALEGLNELVKAGEVGAGYVKADVDFLRANCLGRLALRGEGSLKDAAKAASDFIAKNSTNFHFYEACELAGELNFADGNFAVASEQFTKLTSAPSTDVQMRGHVLLGRAQRNTGDNATARKSFDAALALAAKAANQESVSGVKLTALLGQAECMVDEGQVKEAITHVEKVINEADPEDAELHGQAYSTLGACYLKSGDDKNAMLQYLHVDLLYNSNPAIHAAALDKLTAIYKKLNDRAGLARAESRLKQRYPNYKPKAAGS